MAKDKYPEKDKEKNPVLKPDPKTSNTTDPQEKMEGPVSSIMQNIREEAEENDADDKKNNKNKKT